MTANYRRILFAAGTALLLALGVHLRADDALSPCDLSQPQTRQGCTALTAAQLASQVSGVGISQISNVTFTGSAQAAGEFGGTGAANIIGFGSGILLSSGNVATVVGPNTAGAAGTNLHLPGDSDLTTLSGFTTFDAAVLEFDFVPDKPYVYVDYVFASEEYNEFVNKPGSGGKLFNDVFAFFVNGTNCATLPNPADPAHPLPVSIQTVNDGGPTLGAGTISHPELYINNDFHAQSTYFLNTQMDGLTKVLTCRAPVIANQTNHIKLAIADASDGSLDSVVFLRAAGFRTTPPLTILKKTNSTNNDDPGVSGPLIAVGDPVRWTYEVTNGGFADLTSVAITDDRLGPIVCPTSSLPAPPDPASIPPDSPSRMTCTANGFAVADDYANVGTVSGSSSIVATITDDNPDKYFGAQPSVKIITKTDFLDNDAVPGPLVQAGSPVTWTYEVTNTGNVTLQNISVTDDKTTVDCGIVPGGAPITTLLPTHTMTCTASGIAAAGQYSNTGTVDASIETLDVDGNPKTIPVHDSNPDHYLGVNPKVAIVKKTDGLDNNASPGLLVLAGDPIRSTYIVTNTGDVDLTNVRVEDPEGTVLCTIASLKANDPPYTACTVPDGTALSGKQHSTAFAKTTFQVVLSDGSTKDLPVEAMDDEYYLGADPHIAIVKKLDGGHYNTPDGPSVQAGAPIRWTFEVTNTGNVDLTNVRVEDPSGVAICTFSTLAVQTPPSPSTCTVDDVALKDKQTNTAYAEGSVSVTTVDGTPKVVQAPKASDVEYYVGVDLKLSIVKKTDGSDNNTAPGVYVLAGDPIRFTYTVTNNSNVTLTNVQVEDPKGTVICTIGALAINTPYTQCTVPDGIALPNSQHSTAYATSSYQVLQVDGSASNAPVMAQDDEFYLGADPHVAIVKKLDGGHYNTPDGPSVQAGGPIRWTFEVTNTGNADLTNVSVEDPKGVVVCTIDSLPAKPGAKTCVQDAVALSDKQHNTGWAVGALTVTTVDGNTKPAPVEASDDEYYVGVNPRITLAKTTNGIDTEQGPEPIILTGSSVSWGYSVTNTGNVDLSDITVTDDKEGAICGFASLPVGQTLPCAKPGTAVAGNYANVGTAGGSVPLLQVDGSTPAVPVNAVASNHYFGANPAIAIVKKTVTYVCEPYRDYKDGSHARQDDDHKGDDNVGKDGGYRADHHDGKNDGRDDDREKDKNHYGDKDKEHGTVVGCEPDEYVSPGHGGHDIKDCPDPAHHWAHVSPGHAGHALKDCPDPKNHWDEHVAPSHAGHELKDCPDPRNHWAHVSAGHERHAAKDCPDPENHWEHVSAGHEGHSLKDCPDPEHHMDHGEGSAHGAHGRLVRVETDNNTAPGPIVEVGAKIGWTYTVTNIGNVPLTNVVVTDNHEGAICTIALLDVGQTAPACSKESTALAGQYENVGTATGNFGPVLVGGVETQTVTVTASDLDHYFGAQPGISIVKTTNGVKHDTAPGDSITVGAPVTWTYVITNTGNLPLTRVSLVDDRIGNIVCPSTALTVAPDAASTMTCVATGQAIKGQYENTGTVTATSAFGPVSASDCDFYVGVEPKPEKGPYRKDKDDYDDDHGGDDHADGHHVDGHDDDHYRGDRKPSQGPSKW